ncbi:MAG: hypothetical protein RLZZ200_2969 [Pseudomonadota bacterium]|jgi:hypothetical protein
MKFGRVIALLVLGALPGGVVQGAPPDLTGVWTASRDGKGGPARENFAVEFNATAGFTAEGKARIAEYRALVDESGDSPGAWCVPTGMPGALLLGGGYPMEFIQRPEQLTIIFEAHGEVRRIYLAGPKVDPADLLPTREGYSTGRWDGETLVVETTGLKESVDQIVAHSEDAKIIERYRLDKDPQTGGRLLKADVTVDDPVFYAKPVSFTRVWAPLENGRMMDYDCTEPAWEDRLDTLRRQARGAAAGH